jgi:hypothetical protein
MSMVELSEASLVRDPVAIRDRHPWRAAVIIGLLVAAAGMVYSIALAPWVRGVPNWWIPPDAWVNLFASHWVANAGIAYVYESSALFVATPLFPVLLVPIAVLGSHWSLGESLPFVLRHPSMWWLYGPVMMGSGILVLHAARRLLTVAGARFGLGRVQWALVPLAVFPMAVIFGHAEDVLALALVMWGVAAQVRRRHVWAGILFGLAVASKQWALLGVPLLVATSPRESRKWVVGTAVGIPAAFLLTPLVADWGHASKALLNPRAFVTLGHRAIWLVGSHVTVDGTPFRLGAFVLAFALAWRLRGEQSATRMMAGFAVGFAGRILFEPVVFSYYLGPGLAFLLLHERLSEGTVRRTLVVGTLLLVYFSAHPQLVLWWLGASVMLSMLAASAVADVLAVGRFAPVPEGGAVIPLRGRVSWRRSFAGSRRSPRTGASLGRRGTRAPARARS